MNAFSELRQAARALAKRPGYAAVAAFTLALGIAANAAIFTVVNSILLEPLPYPDSGRIVTVRHHAPKLDLPDLQISPGLIRHYREGSKTLTRLGAFSRGEQNLTGAGRPERVPVVSVTPEIFDVLAVAPALGRRFRDTDVQERSPRVAILTHALWQSHFGGERNVVGRHIMVDGMRSEIVGVMPDRFAFPDNRTRLIVPQRIDPAGDFGDFGPIALARLAPGVTLAAAQSEIDALQRRIPERFTDLGKDFLEQVGWSATVLPMHESLVSDVSTTLWILLATVGLVLLIAGANVTNLFLVRAESRRREMAVRAAIGAGRWHLARSFFAESLLLAAAGGALGLTMAWAAVRLLVRYAPIDLPRLHEVGVDGRVVAFAAALSLGVGLVVGALPMLQVIGRSFATLLHDGGRGATAGRARHRLRHVLIAGQVAMALVLLVASGLMLRSAARLNAVNLGFSVDGLVSAGVSLGSIPDRARAVAFYDQVLEQVRGIPGVVSAGASSSLAIGATSMGGGSFDIESRPRPETALPPVAMYMAVTPGLFETLGVKLLAGRAPERADAARTQQVGWVNQTFARSFLDNRAVGERIRFEDVWIEIVGVVSDIRTFGPNEPMRPFAYMTVGHPAIDPDVMQVVVRTTASAPAVGAALRDAVSRVDRGVPLTSVRLMSEIVDASMAQRSFAMLLLTFAAGGALVLGVVGLYGVIRYIVAQRTAEIGVRIALGAVPREVSRMVLWQGMRVTLAGVVAGIAIALAATRAMASMLFEVSTRDPATFVTVAVALTAVSALATYLPARRAAAIDPSRALRQDG